MIKSSYLKWHSEHINRGKTAKSENCRFFRPINQGSTLIFRSKVLALHHFEMFLSHTNWRFLLLLKCNFAFHLLYQTLSLLNYIFLFQHIERSRDISARNLVSWIFNIQPLLFRMLMMNSMTIVIFNICRKFIKRTKKKSWTFQCFHAVWWREKYMSSNKMLCWIVTRLAWNNDKMVTLA